MADVMSKHTASELVYNKRNLFRVETTTTVEEALKLIRKYNVLSLPVYDSKKSEFVGIVTALDLLAYVAFASFDYKVHFILFL
jgi:CBS domain-containing protein